MNIINQVITILGEMDVDVIDEFFGELDEGVLESYQEKSPLEQITFIESHLAFYIDTEDFDVWMTRFKYEIAPKLIEL